MEKIDSTINNYLFKELNFIPSFLSYFYEHSFKAHYPTKNYHFFSNIETKTKDPFKGQQVFQDTKHAWQFSHFSVNQFYQKKRQIEFVRWLNAFFIDFDDPCDKDKIDTRIKELNLPFPTFIIRTPHNGLHYFWILARPLGASEKEKFTWRFYQKGLNNLFKDLNADPNRINEDSFMRLPKTLDDIVLFEPKNAITGLDMLKVVKDRNIPPEPPLSASVCHDNSKFGTYIGKNGNSHNKGNLLVKINIEALKGKTKGSKDKIGRNQVALWLAILLKRLKYSQQETEAVLANWNRKNCPPLLESRIKIIIDTAFKRKYQVSIRKLREQVGKEAIVWISRPKTNNEALRKARILRLIRRNGGSMAITHRDLSERLKMCPKTAKTSLYELRNWGLLRILKYSVNRDLRGATHICLLVLRENDPFQSSPGKLVIALRERERSYSLLRGFREEEVGDFCKGREIFKKTRSPP